jgi:hypothetical protein
VLLAAVEVKVKKVRVSYNEECRDVSHIIFFELFIPQSVVSMSEKKGKIRKRQLQKNWK